MAEHPYMKLWTDAYLADTTHLTTLEHGAYLLLLMAMWRTASKSLPNDDAKLARFARLTPGQWRRIKPTLMGFFDVAGDQITQSRLTAEANAVRQNRESQSNKARARWLKNHETDDAAASVRHMPTDASHSLERKKERKDGSEIHPKESDAPRARLMRGSRLPDDWEPNADQRAYAEQYGLDACRVAADFRDYWCAVPGQRGLKLDWNRTWQTRCRELADRMAKSRNGSNGHARTNQRPSAEQEFWRRHSSSAGPGSGCAGEIIPPHPASGRG